LNFTLKAALFVKFIFGINYEQNLMVSRLPALKLVTLKPFKYLA